MMYYAKAARGGISNSPYEFVVHVSRKSKTNTIVWNASNSTRRVKQSSGRSSEIYINDAGKMKFSCLLPRSSILTVLSREDDGFEVLTWSSGAFVPVLLPGGSVGWMLEREVATETEII